MARFKLMGYQVQGADQNTQAVPLSEQRKTELQAKSVVYETDDQVEARAIVTAGGFFRDRDNFITVVDVVDSAEPRPQAATFPQKG